jgi:hypothetical protein
MGKIFARKFSVKCNASSLQLTVTAVFSNPDMSLSEGGYLINDSGSDGLGFID